MSEAIYEQRERQEAVAARAEAAAQDLAREVNFQLVTGPGAYAVLGNLKLLLSHLREVADHLPAGLEHSLTDDRISVTDVHFGTGAVRDPAAQIAAAAEKLRTVSVALSTAAEAAGQAQEDLNSQGFEVTAQ